MVIKTQQFFYPFSNFRPISSFHQKKRPICPLNLKFREKIQNLQFSLGFSIAVYVLLKYKLLNISVVEKVYPFFIVFYSLLLLFDFFVLMFFKSTLDGPLRIFPCMAKCRNLTQFFYRQNGSGII